jgi:hypothetical protein
MDKPGNTITVYSTDNELNTLMRSYGSGKEKIAPLTGHYSHTEDFFLQLPSSFRVPSFPIHHNIDEHQPTHVYRNALHEFMHQVVPTVPGLFQGLTYFFDPADTSKPNFYQLYRIKDTLFLYLVQLDLSFKPPYCRLEQKGGNDASHAYTSDKLFLEPLLIPLESYREEGGFIRSFNVEQNISRTWIGERGKGYFVQGIWIDRDLTKFFSKLFLPRGTRSYPYYPFPCKYRTVCHAVLDYTPEGRKRHLGLLYHAKNFLIPHFESIQEALTNNDFREDLPLFESIKTKVPERWAEIWSSLKVKAYLNEQEMKEFRVDFAF